MPERYSLIPDTRPIGLLIGIPTRGTISIETYHSLAHNMCGFQSVTLPAVRMPVDEARNYIAKTFRGFDDSRLPFETPYVLWIDDDAMWPANSLLTAIKHLEDNAQIDILAGYYCSRQRFMAPVAGVNEIGDGCVKPNAGLVEVGFCGFHWVMMRRNVLDKVGDNPFSLQGKGQGAQWEDASFCRRAKQAGLRIFCATDVPVVHIEPETGYGYLPYLPAFKSTGSSLEISVGPPDAEPNMRDYGPKVNRTIADLQSSRNPIVDRLDELRRVPTNRAERRQAERQYSRSIDPS